MMKMKTKMRKLVLDKNFLNTCMITTIPFVLALIITLTAAFRAGYIYRRLEEEVEHAEIRARILAALNNKKEEA